MRTRGGSDISILRLKRTRLEYTAKTPQASPRQYALSLISFFAGVYGYLSFLYEQQAIAFSAWLVFPVVTLFCGVIWLMHHHFRHYLLRFYVVLLPLAGLFIFLQRRPLLAQCQQILKYLRGLSDAEPVSATLVITLVSACVGWCVFWLGYVINLSGVLVFATSLLLLIGPFAGIDIPLSTIILLTLYLVSVALLRTTGGTPKKAAGGVPKKATGGTSKKVAVKQPNLRTLLRSSHRVMFVVLLISFASAAVFVSIRSDFLYQSVYDLEGRVQRALREISGTASDPVQGGYIASGNNYPLGTTQLELTVSDQPSETLYLRGYGGGTYAGGHWIRSSDEEIFARIANDYPEEIWSKWMSQLFYRMYSEMNSYMHADGAAQARSLLVRHTGNTYDTRYVPYFGRIDAADSGSTAAGYNFLYYEQGDMQISAANIRPEYREYYPMYRQIQDTYQIYGHRAYTRVPEELLPRLVALCEENPQGTLPEITDFILTTLHSQADYTLTPGFAPLNTDIVESFLFERHTGYCVHFASAATLMFRLYDIPARYATGYIVSPGDFDKDPEDGSYHADVTDHAAHAWVEIFQPDYGWMPIEVTPGGGMNTVSSESDETDHTGSHSSPEPDGGGLLDSKDADTGNEDTPNEDAPDETVSGEQPGAVLSLNERQKVALVTLLICSLGLLPLLPCLIWLVRRKRLDDCDCRKLFSRFMDMLHFAGYPKENDGSEALLPDWLEEQTGIPAADTRRMTSAATRLAFGPDGADTEQEIYIRGFYKHAAAGIYRTLSRPRRWIFRYLKGFY